MKSRIVTVAAILPFLVSCGGDAGSLSIASAQDVDKNTDNAVNTAGDSSIFTVPLVVSESDEKPSSSALDVSIDSGIEDALPIVSTGDDNSVGVNSNELDPDDEKGNEKEDNLPSDAAGKDDGIDEILEVEPDKDQVEPIVDPVNTPVSESEPPVSMTDEDRTPPGVGTYRSQTIPIKANGADQFPNTGPLEVNANRIASPGLRFGEFLLINNPWNFSAASYALWYQEISLAGDGNNTHVMIDWDWGTLVDTSGSLFNTKSFPEVVYGSRSGVERSGTYAETGLPVEYSESPVWTIDYSYHTQGRRSESAGIGGSDSDYNVVIESFYHDSCDIKRDGLATDNMAMEIMVWLKYDLTLPSGSSPHSVPFISSDGRVFDVYTKTINRAFVAYVAREDSGSGTIMYSELLNDAKHNAASYGIYQLKDTDCMANILLGTEIWHGAGSFTLTDYQISRTY